MKLDFAIFSTQTVTPTQVKSATVGIKDGKIAAIYDGAHNTLDCPVENMGDLVLMPGVIDAHVHINQPGRTHWEGFDTATKAAAVGGITTLVDMPLNSTPVTTSVSAFQEKINAAKNLLHVNCAFWGGLIPGMEEELKALLSSGIMGIKVFLTHSGIDDFPNVTANDLYQAMPLIAQQKLPLLVHCELDHPHSDQIHLRNNPTSYQAYLKSRPKEWENKAIELMIQLCRKYNCRTHIVHLSSSEALPMIRKAKSEGLPLTVETCPQYLFFNAEEIPDGQTQFKCAPPIREAKNQEKLWEALREGLIDFITTDHSPAPPDLKQMNSGDFSKAWGGIASVQFLLPALWTAAKQRGFNITDISKWTAEKVAPFVGLNKKGKIEVGFDADLVVWNPNASFSVKEEEIYHRHKITPYLGQTLYGKVIDTYIAGKKIVADGRLIQPNQGIILTL